MHRLLEVFVFSLVLLPLAPAAIVLWVTSPGVKP